MLSTGRRNVDSETASIIAAHPRAKTIASAFHDQARRVTAQRRAMFEQNVAAIVYVAYVAYVAYVVYAVHGEYGVRSSDKTH